MYLKLSLPVLLFCVLMTGCTSHYYQVNNDTLFLYLKKTDAEHVSFASSLDGFEAHRVQKHHGKWVVSLPSGNPFHYYYVIDGELFLPSCQMRENDDFGSENCIFEPD